MLDIIKCHENAYRKLTIIFLTILNAYNLHPNLWCHFSIIFKGQFEVVSTVKMCPTLWDAFQLNLFQSALYSPIL